MKVLSAEAINRVLSDHAVVLGAVEEAFIAHGAGGVVHPPPIQMLFSRQAPTVDGDCHVKTAYTDAFPFFSVKVATGFYTNATRGLPVNNGVVMLLSAETGAPSVLLQDDGAITSARTAAAGVLATRVRKGDQPFALGIVGTGHQAELQARWISQFLNVTEVFLTGRSAEKASALADRLTQRDCPAHAVKVDSLADNADVIVTTTPAQSPVLFRDHVRDGHHIVALGADSPGKQELDVAIVGAAKRVWVDDHAQCQAHGEFGHAVRAGVRHEHDYQSIGSQLEGGSAELDATAITVADLTGLGVQDLYTAALVYRRLLENA
ncbi:MAG: ornithine cyclodeaminase [Pseudomonadota bacterium]